MRTIAILALPLLAGLAGNLAAQDLPGVEASLRPERGIVLASQEAVLVLTLDISQDASLPSDLLTGVQLEAQTGTAAPVKIKEAGKGGRVDFAAGTRIERRLRVPASRLAPTAGSADLANVAISWPGLAGASCVIKVAPDVTRLNVEDLDLAKTKIILVTSHGEMTLAFRPDKAPNHVRNFVKLSMSGFYDGTRFHRVIRNFMIQGGDPNTKDDTKVGMWGQGDPGYKIDAEFNDIKHVRGVLAMARGPDPNSAGCQFFLCHKDSGHLDGQYTAFGNLEAGADVLDSIAGTAVGQPHGTTPVKPVILHHAIVLPVTKQ